MSHFHECRQAALWLPGIGFRHAVKAMENASAQRGLWKLMLRLPALRGQLQILSVHWEDGPARVRPPVPTREPISEER